MENKQERVIEEGTSEHGRFKLTVKSGVYQPSEDCKFGTSRESLYTLGIDTGERVIEVTYRTSAVDGECKRDCQHFEYCNTGMDVVFSEDDHAQDFRFSNIINSRKGSGAPFRSFGELSQYGTEADPAEDSVMLKAYPIVEMMVGLLKKHGVEVKE